MALNTNEVIIDIENLNKSFELENSSKLQVLDDISFSVKKGETLGIIGGTGAGKSTLLSLILKSYSLDGEPAVDGKPVLSVLGRPIEDWSLAEERRRIGYVPQKSVLFSGTVRELWWYPNLMTELTI